MELTEVRKPSENILIDLDLKYRMNSADREQFKEEKFISYLLIRHAISVKYPQSMPRTDSKIWALTQDELFSEPKKLSLSRSEFDWLFELIDQCDYPGLMSSWRWTLLNHLDELKRA